MQFDREAVCMEIICNSVSGKAKRVDLLMGSLITREIKAWVERMKGGDR